MKADYKEFLEHIPKQVELEQTVLGMVIISTEVFPKIHHILRDDSFQNKWHQRIFKAAKELFTDHSPVNYISMDLKMKKYDGWRPDYMIELTRPIANTSNCEWYAYVLEEFAIVRRMSKTLLEKASTIGNGDVFENIAQMTSEIESNYGDAILQRAAQSSQRFAELYSKATDKSRELIKTGLYNLDRKVGGIDKGNLIVIGARPGNGKTALAIALAHKMAAQGKKVQCYNLEMPSTDIAAREVAMYSGIPYESLRRWEMNADQVEQYQQAINHILRLPVTMVACSSLRTIDVRSKIAKEQQLGGVDVVIIDYLHLMEHNRLHRAQNDAEVLGNTTRELKLMAKDMNVCIIILSQLNRDTEKRNEGRPNISDLRSSGAIEQDADMVWLLYNPSMYNVSQDAEGNSLAGKMEIMIQKNRHGDTGSVYVNWNPAINLFSNDNREFGNERL